jgi:hypothetical protein
MDVRHPHGGGDPNHGPHAHCLREYGVKPEEDASTAVDKLNAKAPQLARLLREVATS